MIRRSSMGSICWPSNPGRRSTEDTAFIQYFDGREPQIHEVWSLVLCRIILEVHPTAQVEVVSGTIREFVTNYLPENGQKIQIIRQLSINNSVQFLGVPYQAWGFGLLFLSNLQAPAEATGWVIRNYTNHDFRRSMLGANIITNIACGTYIDASPANLP